MEDKCATNACPERRPTVPKKFEIGPTHLGDDSVASMFLDKVVYCAYWSLVQRIAAFANEKRSAFPSNGFVRCVPIKWATLSWLGKLIFEIQKI